MSKKRRPYGAGSLRHLGGERYRFQIRADNRTLSRVFTARNETEANKEAGEVRRDLLEKHERSKDGRHAEREQRQTWTVEQYVAYYLEKYAPHLASTTRARYRSVFKHNVCPYIGKMRMAEVTASDLMALYAKLGSPGSRKLGGPGALSGSTISTVRNILRSLFAFAVSEGDLPASPAVGKAARPNVDMTPARKRGALSVAEVEKFVKLVSKEAPQIAVPVMLSAYLGTRRGETVGLRWEDVDFDARTITVRRSVSRTVEDGVQEKSTKTGRLRTIPLDPHTLAELRRIRRDQREARLGLGEDWRGAKTHEGDFIATEADGEGMRPDRFGLSFRTFCEQQKITNVTPHLLRHAWVSQMIALGFDAVTISAMAGHSPDVLLKTYAHAFDSRKREAMDALGEARKAAHAAI